MNIPTYSSRTARGLRGNASKKRSPHEGGVVTSSRRDDDSPNLSGCPFATIPSGPGITATTPRPFATITAQAGGSVSIPPAPVCTPGPDFDFGETK